MSSEDIISTFEINSVPDPWSAYLKIMANEADILCSWVDQVLVASQLFGNPILPSPYTFALVIKEATESKLVVEVLFNLKVGTINLSRSRTYGMSIQRYYLHTGYRQRWEIRTYLINRLSEMLLEIHAEALERNLLYPY